MKIKCFTLAFKVFHILATAYSYSIISHYSPALILCQIKLIYLEQWHVAMFLILSQYLESKKLFKSF